MKFKEELQDAKMSAGDGDIADIRSRRELSLFSIAQLKEFCRAKNQALSGTKAVLVERIAVHLGLPAEDFWHMQRARGLRYPELAAHDIAYKLKSWIYVCARRAAERYFLIGFWLLLIFLLL